MPRTKQFKVNEAIDSALDLFWNNGYHATSMQELVDELRINRASMYDTFRSKKHLYILTLEAYSESYLKWWNDTLYYDTIVRSGIIKLLEHENSLLSKEGIKRPCFILKSTLELYGQDELASELIDKHNQSLLEMLINYLSYGVNQGQISPYKNLPLLAELILDMIRGVSAAATFRVEQDYIKKQSTQILSLLN